MSRTTVTRQALRRAIALDLVMPFFTRTAAGEATVTSVTGTQIVDSGLTQPDDFWNNQWIYIPESNKTFRIKDFISTTHTLVTESTPTGIIPGTKYEIYQVFSPIEINQAINRAVRDSYPDFYDTVSTNELVLCRNKLEYDLGDITPAVAMILGVAIDRPTRRIYGKIDSVVDAGTTLTIADADLDLTDVTTSWLVSFFSGAGSGSWTTITAVNAGAHTFTCADGGQLADTEFMLWDPNYQTLDWFDLRSFNVDTEEFPNYLRVNFPIDVWLGSRLQIIYNCVPVNMTEDDDTTFVPEGYIVPKAISILASTRINDSRYDRQKFAIIEQSKKQEADEFRNRNYFRPSGIVHRLGKTDRPTYLDPINGDPLGWNNG